MVNSGSAGKAHGIRLQGSSAKWADKTAAFVGVRLVKPTAHAKCSAQRRAQNRCSINAVVDVIDRSQAPTQPGGHFSLCFPSCEASDIYSLTISCPACGFPHITPFKNLPRVAASHPSQPSSCWRPPLARASLPPVAQEEAREVKVSATEDSPPVRGPAWAWERWDRTGCQGSLAGFLTPAPCAPRAADGAAP